MDQTDQYIDRVLHLPPAPTIVNQLLGLFNDPNREIDRVVELISYDPSLTAEVLRRCNSAFFRGAEPAADIFAAVTRLGFYEVYCVIVAAIGARAMTLARPGGALDPETLWRHSVSTAVGAAALAKRVQEAEPLAFTAGLLHDIGKLILISVEEKTYGNVLEQAGPCGMALVKAEDAAFGTTHAVLGARLLARWGLPPSVALVVLHHHRSLTASASFEKLAATVQLANELARHLDDSPPLLMNLIAGRPELTAALQLTSEETILLTDQIKQELRRVEGLLKMTA